MLPRVALAASTADPSVVVLVVDVVVVVWSSPLVEGSVVSDSITSESGSVVTSDSELDDAVVDEVVEVKEDIVVALATVDPSLEVVCGAKVVEMEPESSFESVVVV